MQALIAVVEIDGTAGIIILAVFATVIVLVGFVAWMIVRNVTASAVKDPETWRFSTNIPLPLSQGAFDRVAQAGTKAITRPVLTPKQQQFVTGLATTRKTLASVYRLGLIIGGIVGIALSVVIYRDYRDDEMILLPVGIIFLVSLGVLFSGLIPSRTVDPIEPIDPQLFRNVHVNASTSAMEIQFDDVTTHTAIERLKRGADPEYVAREITPGYDQLSESDRQQIQDAVRLLSRSLD